VRRFHVLVEGPTEGTFVRNVLQPYLLPRGLWAEPILIATKRVKAGGTFRGGVASGQQVLNEVARLLYNTSAVAVTTLIDYYGLPSDFPGMSDRPTADPYRRVAHVEAEFASRVGNRRFIPHLTLHEFEAWVYVEPQTCAWVFDDPDVVRALEAIRDRKGGPERINETFETCPSRQILRVYPRYRKEQDGPIAVEAIGLDRVRTTCPHADAWLGRLESL
jgi:hypothetical protein